MNRSEIDERFFNFSPEFRDAVEQFQITANPALIDPVLDGVMRKYLPEGTSIEKASGPLEAFGVESLTLIEVVLDLQDAFGIQLTEQELRGLADLGEARALLVGKARARAGVATDAP